MILNLIPKGSLHNKLSSFFLYRARSIKLFLVNLQKTFRINRVILKTHNLSHLLIMGSLLHNLNSRKLPLNSDNLDLVFQLRSDLLIGEMKLDFLLQKTNKFHSVNFIWLVINLLVFLWVTLLLVLFGRFLFLLDNPKNWDYFLSQLNLLTFIGPLDLKELIDPFEPLLIRVDIFL